uniref:Serpentine receptor class gamma n=1 Tax=Globodera rostochiensis TaxID=31243 RepID=A0A914H753_GLORO
MFRVSICDLMYVLTSYCANRLPSMIGLFFTQHTFQATNLVTAFILLNRLTAIIMPLKHEKLWCKFLPFITMFVFCMPILTSWPIFNMNGIIQFNNPNSTTDRNFIVTEAANGPYLKYYVYVCAVFSAIFTVLCVLINIATFVAYKLHVKNSNNNNGIEIEKKLLVYALATFFGHMLLASYYLSFTIINLDDPKTRAMVYVYYSPIMDTTTVMFSSFFLLWASSPFRQQLLKDFALIRRNNRVAAQEGPPRNNHQFQTSSLQRMPAIS